MMQPHSPLSPSPPNKPSQANGWGRARTAVSLEMLSSGVPKTRIRASMLPGNSKCCQKMLKTRAAWVLTLKPSS